MLPPWKSVTVTEEQICVGRTVRAGENERGVYCGLGEGCGQTREGAWAVNTCTVYWKMAAQMEGNYSMNRAARARFATICTSSRARNYFS